MSTHPARHLQTWTTMPCDHCHQDFAATRTRERDVAAGEWVVCEGCETYAQGFEDGKEFALRETSE